MLEFHDISKFYKGGTAALTGVSFSVPEGQFCVILGPSGSGKSTALRMVNALTEPSGGHISIDGVRVSSKTLPKLRPTIAMIHQSFNLVSRSSVARNVISGALPIIGTWRALFGLFPKSLTQKACTLLAEVGLDADHLRRRVSTLSGGQQQRVGIARAFMLDPRIILADEPVASLDPKISVDVMRILVAEAKARKATVLCSLHQIDLARQFAERIIALKAGKIIFDGSPAQLTPQVIAQIYEEKHSATVDLT